MDTPPEAAPPASTALERIPIPEHVDFDVIKNDIAPSVDKIIARANNLVGKLAAGIKDDETMMLAVAEAEHLRDNGQDLFKKWREEFYMERWYRPGEEVREFFDSRLKPLAAHMKTLLGHVSDYKNKKEREARLARERAEAEARRQRDEAERKQREADEAERRAKQAVEDEKRRKYEAEEAERRRVQAEKEAQERREREARELAAAETQRKLKEEEEARMKHAEVAHEVGNGAAKVDTILESATPISPVLAKPEQAKDQEALRLEQENARKVADAKAEQERQAAAEAEKKRQEAEAEAYRLRQEADAAAAASIAAHAAAAAVVPPKTETGTTSTVRFKWDLDSDGTERGDCEAVLKLLKAIVEGRAPITYCGFDPKHPEQFRPTQIGKDVTDLKDRFKCDGLRAYPQQDEQLKRRVVGGRR